MYMYDSKVAKVAFAHPKMQSAHAEVGVAGAEIYALGNGVADFLGLTNVTCGGARSPSRLA